MPTPEQKGMMFSGLFATPGLDVDDWSIVEHDGRVQ